MSIPLTPGPNIASRYSAASRRVIPPCSGHAVGEIGGSTCSVDDPKKRRSTGEYRRNIAIMPDPTRSRISARHPSGSTRRPVPWTVKEVLEQVAWAGEDAEAVARALVDWAADHAGLTIRGGRGLTDRAFTMYAGSGRGKGVLSLYAAENDGGPMLELRLKQICFRLPYGHEARIQLMDDFRALGIPRLDAEDIATATRPNIPLAQLTSGRLERLLTLVDRRLA